MAAALNVHDGNLLAAWIDGVDGRTHCAALPLRWHQPTVSSWPGSSVVDGVDRYGRQDPGVAGHRPGGHEPD